MYRGLPKNIYVLFFVQLINRLGEFVVPFLSLFLVSKLGCSTKITGIIVSCAFLVQIPGSMAGGTIADYWSRKKTYIISQSAAALCILLCAFVSSKGVIITLLILSAFFSAGAKPLINTMVYDSLEPSKRKLGQSLSYLGINLGVCIGPLMASFLFNHYLKLFFIGDAFTSFLAVALVAAKLKDLKSTGETSSRDVVSTKDFVLHIVKKPKLCIFFLIFLSFSFVYAQHSFSLPLMLKNSFGDKGTVYFGYVMSTNALTVVLFTAWITFKTRKKSSLSNVALAGIFYAMGFGLITVATTFFVYIISTVLWTFGEVLISTNSEIYVVNQSEESMRARCCAIMMIVGSVGRAFGVFAMGGFIGLFGLLPVWPFIMVLALATSIYTYFLNARSGQTN